MTIENTQIDLETIVTAKRKFLEKRRAKTPNVAVVALAEMQGQPKPVLNVVTGGARVTLIGQITLTETYDPVAMALRYIRDKVDAVSLFTDQLVYSKGMDDLLLVSRGVQGTPVICQDYILSEYHVTEARAAGASALVAHSSILERAELRRIVSLAHRWKMTAIVQVNNEDEMVYAASVSPHVLAVGDGNVYFDPEYDLPLLEHLIPLVPYHAKVMALGCMQNMDDVAAVAELGVDAIIADETLITPRDNLARLRALLERRPS